MTNLLNLFSKPCRHPGYWTFVNYRSGLEVANILNRYPNGKLFKSNRNKVRIKEMQFYAETDTRIIRKLS